MRLFVGLDIPEEVKDKLAGFIGEMRREANLRWSSVANLHITTKFIGEWPAERLDEMKSALATVTGIAAFPIVIRGLGWYPNPHSPRIFWAAVRADASLPDLARATEDAVAALGVEKEKRAYSPHLTVARIDQSPDLSALRRKVASLPSDEFGQFTAREFHLYLSQPGPRGSIYSKLATYPLIERSKEQ
jgi:2'-5' RNA ligase